MTESQEPNYDDKPVGGAGKEFGSYDVPAGYWRLKIESGYLLKISGQSLRHPAIDHKSSWASNWMADQLCGWQRPEFIHCALGTGSIVAASLPMHRATKIIGADGPSTLDCSRMQMSLTCVFLFSFGINFHLVDFHRQI